MVRLLSVELVRLRSIGAARALSTLAVYAKRDTSSIPKKSIGTERWRASAGAREFEFLVYGSDVTSLNTQSQILLAPAGVSNPLGRVNAAMLLPHLHYHMCADARSIS